MSLISGFTNQTAEYKARTGGDGFGGDAYADPETIKVRKERRQQWVSDPSGVQVKATTYILAERILNVGDQIDGRRVVAVEDVVDKAGKTLGTEAYL